MRPNAATTLGMLGDCKVEMMLDSGSSISLIQESTAAPFTMEHKITPSGLQLTSASGDNIPIVGCMTLPIYIELQTTHPLVVVKSLIAPVILGLDFLQKHGMILDFMSSQVKINSQFHEPDCSENIKPIVSSVVSVSTLTAHTLFVTCLAMSSRTLRGKLQTRYVQSMC